MLLTMVISFFLLMIIGTPVGFSIGISSLIGLLVQSDIPLIVIPQIMFSGVDRYLFLAMPFFILTGVAMTELELTDKVVNLANALVGHMKGGLAQVNIIASVIFGGIQGSGNADTAAIGSLLIPSMIKDGYSKGYSCAVTASSSTLAPIIPPSMMMVVYGGIAEVSIGELFIAGFLPGFVMAILLMILAHFYAVRGAQKSKPKKAFAIKNVILSIIEGGPALFTAVIIVGGILGGIFTPTESGAVAAVYALLIGAFYYKTLTWKKLWKVFVSGGLITAMAGVILSCSAVFNWILTSEEIPTRILNYMFSIGLSRVGIIFAIIIFVYIVGSFMDVMASMIILVPLLAPIGVQLGYDPVNWGVLIVLLFCMGGITPPLGINLFIATSIAGCKYSETARAVIPFVFILIIAVLCVAFIPFLTLYLPNVFMR